MRSNFDTILLSPLKAIEGIGEFIIPTTPVIIYISGKILIARKL